MTEIYTPDGAGKFSKANGKRGIARVDPLGYGQVRTVADVFKALGKPGQAMFVTRRGIDEVISGALRMVGSNVIVLQEDGEDEFAGQVAVHVIDTADIGHVTIFETAENTDFDERPAEEQEEETDAEGTEGTEES